MLSPRMTVHVKRGLYHEFIREVQSDNSCMPDVIVGLNVGFEAYASWKETLQLINVSVCFLPTTNARWWTCPLSSLTPVNTPACGISWSWRRLDWRSLFRPIWAPISRWIRSGVPYESPPRAPDGPGSSMPSPSYPGYQLEHSMRRPKSHPNCREWGCDMCVYVYLVTYFYTLTVNKLFYPCQSRLFFSILDRWVG